MFHKVTPNFTNLKIQDPQVIYEEIVQQISKDPALQTSQHDHVKTTSTDLDAIDEVRKKSIRNKASALKRYISEPILSVDTNNGRRDVTFESEIWESIIAEVKDIYEQTKNVDAGRVADYIPQLAKVDATKYAVAIYTVDNQKFGIGEVEEDFCLQAVSMPITYCVALEKVGETAMHKHVGREPSGIIIVQISLIF